MESCFFLKRFDTFSRLTVLRPASHVSFPWFQVSFYRILPTNATWIEDIWHASAHTGILYYFVSSKLLKICFHWPWSDIDIQMGYLYRTRL